MTGADLGEGPRGLPPFFFWKFFKQRLSDGILQFRFCFIFRVFLSLL